MSEAPQRPSSSDAAAAYLPVTNEHVESIHMPTNVSTGAEQVTADLVDDSVVSTAATDANSTVVKGDTDMPQLIVNKETTHSASAPIEQPVAMDAAAPPPTIFAVTGDGHVNNSDPDKFFTAQRSSTHDADFSSVQPEPEPQAISPVADSSTTVPSARTEESTSVPPSVTVNENDVIAFDNTAVVESDDLILAGDGVPQTIPAVNVEATKTEDRK
ncbi:hypothetical protein V1511DRAFT_500840 [Dipodascopsis uninucleata]